VPKLTRRQCGSSFMRLLFLFLFSIATASAADSLLINGRKILVPTPDGFVRVTGQMQALEEYSRKMKDPANDMLAFYIPEAAAPEALSGKIPSFDRWLVVKVNKELRGVFATSRDFALLKSGMVRHLEEANEQVKARVNEALRETSQSISKSYDTSFSATVSDMMPLPVHYETPDTLSYSMHLGYGATNGSENSTGTMIATSTIMNVSGTILFLYCYAPKDQLDWSRTFSRDWSNSILASNENLPAGRKSSFWDKALSRLLTATVVGGLGGLIFGGILIWKARKKA